VAPSRRADWNAGSAGNGGNAEGANSIRNYGIGNPGAISDGARADSVPGLSDVASRSFNDGAESGVLGPTVELRV
jgi:hypothetical protein